MRYVASFIAILATTSLLAADKEPRDSDKQFIQGRWKLLSATDNGKKFTKEEFAGRSMTFSGDRFTGPKKRQPRPGKFELDAETDPKQIDRIDVPQADIPEPLQNGVRDQRRIAQLREGRDDDAALAATF